MKLAPVILILIVDLAVLGAALFGLLEAGPIRVNDPTLLTWAWYYLHGINLVFGFNAGLRELSLPVLALATSQVGLLAIWAALGRGPAWLRWLAAGAGIWLWTCAFSVVFNRAAPASKSAVLLLGQLLCLAVPLLMLHIAGYRFQLRRAASEPPKRDGASWQYTLGGMLLMMTGVAVLLGLLPYLSIDGWTVLEGAGCAASTAIALAALAGGKWWPARLGLLCLAPPAVGYGMMRWFDHAHRWWGAGSYLPDHWAFTQRYLPYLVWMLLHAWLVAVVLLLFGCYGYAVVRKARKQPLRSGEE